IMRLAVQVDIAYKRWWGLDRRLSRQELIRLFIDLLHRIGGNGSADGDTSARTPSDRIDLLVTQWPWESDGRARPAMRTLLAAMFCCVGACNTGRARVVLDPPAAAAQGRVAIFLNPGDPGPGEAGLDIDGDDL